MSDTAAPRRLSQWRALLFAMLVLCAGLLGEKCPPRFLLADQSLTANPDTCTMLQSTNPLALAFASNTLWVANAAPLAMVPFEVDEAPPQIPSGMDAFLIPGDSDRNGTADTEEDTGLPPVIDDIIVASTSELLLPTFNKEAVLRFAPTGALLTSNVSVPEEFDEEDNPELPAPGNNRNQTGFSTKTCVVPRPGALDTEGLPPIADCAASTGFFSRTTSGVAVDSERGLALVTFENRSLVAHQPGVVAVYDFGAGISPHQIGPTSTKIATIFTSGFAPTDIVIYATTDVNDDPRRFALVAVSGSNTPALTEAAIDVIDIDTLELVASFPLGLGGISPAGIQIDAARSVAVVGSTVAREIYAVDLGVLQDVDIPTTIEAGDEPLDLSAGVIFDRTTKLALDRIDAAIPGCPGAILGLGFNFAGTRLFATDNCDGSFITIEYASTETGAARFGAQAVTDFAAPRDATGTRPRGAGRLVVRPERLRNYDGPDVFVLVDEPEGMVCALFVDADSP